jgi:hypothetical protein
LDKEELERIEAGVLLAFKEDDGMRASVEEDLNRVIAALVAKGVLYVTGLDGHIPVIAVTVIGQAIDGDEERVAAGRGSVDTPDEAIGAWCGDGDTELGLVGVANNTAAVAAGFDVLSAGGVPIIEDVEGAKEKPIFGFLGERPTRAVWRRRG